MRRQIVLHHHVDASHPQTPAEALVSTRNTAVERGDAVLEIAGLGQLAAVGNRCRIELRYGRGLGCDIVGLSGDRALALPFGPLEGVGLGCKVELVSEAAVLRPSTPF